MSHTVSVRRMAVPVLVLLFVAAGCAARPSAQPQQAGADIGVECPAGHTLTCEARTTGRIHHGSFRKDNDRCACVREGMGGPQSPVIPSIGQ